MPVEMPWVKKAPALVQVYTLGPSVKQFYLKDFQAFFGGNECGNAIADVLFGKYNPSGKLPVTFPKVYEDVPSSKNFGNALDTVYAEGLKVGYRYFDRPGGVESEFPFGYVLSLFNNLRIHRTESLYRYGLSYTTFGFSDLSVQTAGMYGLKVEFTIKNTGDVAGSEIGQVYIHDIKSRVERPDVELKGFARAFLQPGESKRLSVTLDVCVSLHIAQGCILTEIQHSALSYYDTTLSSWVGEAGDFEIRVGPSSVQTAVAAPYTLTESFTWIGLGAPKAATLYRGA